MLDKLNCSEHTVIPFQIDVHRKKKLPSTTFTVFTKGESIYLSWVEQAERH